MKTFFKFLVAFALTFTTLSGLAQNASTTFHSQTFLSGNGYMILTNPALNLSYTNTVYTTNIPYMAAGGNMVFSLTSSNVVYTNAVNQITNTLFYGPAIQDVNGFSDMNGDVTSNATLMIAINFTNIAINPTISGPNNPYNPYFVLTNGYTGLLPYATNITSASTNTLTFTFSKSPDEFANTYKSFTNNVAPAFFDTSGNGQWSFSIAAPGTTPYVITTNVPASLLIGAKYLRMSVAVSSNSAAAISANTDVIINAVKLGGYF
jgi:hypothetical protein